MKIEYNSVKKLVIIDNTPELIIPFCLRIFIVNKIIILNI